MKESIVKNINKVHRKLANYVASFASSLVILICIDVLMRYLFNVSFIAITELEWYFFSILFLLGLSYTFKSDRHVRVDVFYNGFSKKKKDLVNKFGIVLFLIPFCLLVIYYSGKYTYNSWLIMEGSPEANGLPWRFLIKSLIPFGYTLLLFQAVLFLFTKVDSE
ncbi:MAG: TRAP transporter small permease subunit [Cytophagales bacterium]